MKNLKRLLALLIKEELGRDLESPRPDPLNWRDYPGIHVIITADPVGNKYIAEIEVEDDESLSTGAHDFTSEAAAMGWARMKADHAFNKLMNRPGYTTNKKKFT